MRSIFADEKPHLPHDLGSCYAEIVRQTKRANEAERRIDALTTTFAGRLSAIEARLRPTPPAPTAFYPGKFATNERGRS